MPLRLIFMGTPDFAVPTLNEIVERGHEVLAVYTRAPKPAGRGMAPAPTPVERAAVTHQLAVLAPESLRGPEVEAAFRAHQADAAVVVAYGLILPRSILDVLPRKFFNLHASLLPCLRGAAPINRAIMEGKKETGVTVMRMEVGLDTGPIAKFKKVPIAPDMTAGELHDRLAELGAELMARSLDAFERGTLRTKRQPKEGTYAAKLDRAKTRIDWQRPWHDVHNHIRGLSPFPGAWFELAIEGKPVRIKVLRTVEERRSGEPGTLLDDRLTIACANGAVRILELQRAGGRPMAAEDFLRGLSLKPGLRLD